MCLMSLFGLTSSEDGEKNDKSQTCRYSQRGSQDYHDGGRIAVTQGHENSDNWQHIVNLRYSTDENRIWQSFIVLN